MCYSIDDGGSPYWCLKAGLHKRARYANKDPQTYRPFYSSRAGEGHSDRVVSTDYTHSVFMSMGHAEIVLDL